jgi:hypothetical protein
MTKGGLKDERQTRCMKARSQASDASQDPSEDPSETVSVPSGSPSEVQPDTEQEVAGETSQQPAQTPNCWDILLSNSLEVFALLASSSFLIYWFVSGFKFSIFQVCFSPAAASIGA